MHDSRIFFDTPGLMKMVPSVHTLLMIIIIKFL